MAFSRLYKFSTPNNFSALLMPASVIIIVLFFSSTMKSPVGFEPGTFGSAGVPLVSRFAT